MVFVVVIIIVVVTVMAFAVGIVALVIVVMVMMVVVVPLLLGEKSFKLGFKRVLLFHRLKDLLSVKLVPRGGDEGCILIDAADYPDRLVQLVLRYSGGAAEYDGGGKFYLIAVEFLEVAHIHPALGRVDYGSEGVERHSGDICALYGSYYIAQLADARGLDNDPVGAELLRYFFQCFAEISDERAADAAGIHLGDLDSGFFQKSSINADLTKFILDKHQFFAAVCFFNQFLYECGLSGSEKAGEYVNLDQLFIPPKRRLRLFNISLYHTLPTISSRQGKIFVTSERNAVTYKSGC